jgi:hypothetical protein
MCTYTHTKHTQKINTHTLNTHTHTHTKHTHIHIRTHREGKRFRRRIQRRAANGGRYTSGHIYPGTHMRTHIFIRTHKAHIY